MTGLGEVEREILRELLAEFVAQGRSASDLNHSYFGVSLADLRVKLCESGVGTSVDFDLAVKGLERTGFIGTGPMEPFKNEPGSSVVVIAMFSKYEYAYLTENGYKKARDQSKTKKSVVKPAVHISGGSFYQSPIGLGNEVRQSVTINLQNRDEVVERLVELLRESRKVIDESTKQEVAKIVELGAHGEVGKAKGLFQRVFESVADGAQKAAWDIVAAVIRQHMGL